MGKWILLVVLTLTGVCGAQTPRVSQLARAIARTEGFYRKGTIPNRLHNPGDLCTRYKHAYAGQVGTHHGYAVFSSDAWGWAALESQIQLIVDGESKRYTQEMTFAQIGHRYAESPRWTKNVCAILKIGPNVTFAEFMELPPRVIIDWRASWPS